VTTENCFKEKRNEAKSFGLKLKGIMLGSSNCFRYPYDI
jgi:hypothetical protein